MFFPIAQIRKFLPPHYDTSYKDVVIDAWPARRGAEYLTGSYDAADVHPAKGDNVYPFRSFKDLESHLFFFGKPGYVVIPAEQLKYLVLWNRFTEQVSLHLVTAQLLE